MGEKVKTKKRKKFRRRFNPRLIKHHANYSTQDIADLLHVHISTVDSWYELGLRTIDKERPFLVFGEDLIDFLTRKNTQMKKKSAPDEFFCCKCKAPRKTQEGIAGLKVLSSKKIMIEGLCIQCGTRMNKLGACVRIGEYQKLFNVQVIQQEHLLGCDITSVITDEKGV